MRYLILLLLLLTSCSLVETIHPSEPIPKDKINYISNIQHCTVFLDHIECLGADGNIYYVMRNEIDKKTTWDKSAWK